MNIFIFSCIALLSISSLSAGKFTPEQIQQSKALYKYLEEKHPAEVSLDTVEQFFKNGASPMIAIVCKPINREPFAMPIMHWLIAFDHHKAKVIEAFCKHGYDLKKEHFSGMTALHAAFISDNIPAAKVLLAHAQEDDFLHQDNKGLTPLDYALVSEAAENDRVECLTLMLNKINSINYKENPLIQSSMAYAQGQSTNIQAVFTQWLK